MSKKTKAIKNLVNKLGALKNVSVMKRKEEQKAHLAKQSVLMEKDKKSRTVAEKEKRQLRYIFGKKNKINRK